MRCVSGSIPRTVAGRGETQTLAVTDGDRERAPPVAGLEAEGLGTTRAGLTTDSHAVECAAVVGADPGGAVAVGDGGGLPAEADGGCDLARAYVDQRDAVVAGAR